MSLRITFAIQDEGAKAPFKAQLAFLCKQFSDDYAGRTMTNFGEPQLVQMIGIEEV